MIEATYIELCKLRSLNDNLGLVLDDISAALEGFELISVREIHSYVFSSDYPKAQKVLENIYQHFELLLQNGIEPLSSLNLLGSFIENQSIQTFHRSLNEASNSVVTVENWDDVLFVILLRILDKGLGDESILSELEFNKLKDGVIKQVLYLFQRRLTTFGLDSNFIVRVMSDDRYREYRGHLIPLLVEL